MNRESAKAWLRRETAADSEPRLGPEDVEAMLEEVSPGAADYSVAQLNRAAARGWEWKTNAASETYGRESDIYEHCKERLGHYKTRASGGGGAVVKTAETGAVKGLL